MAGARVPWLPLWIKQPIKALIFEAVREAVQRHPAQPSSAGSVTPPRVRTSQYLGNGTILTETFFDRLIFVDGEDNSVSPHIIHQGRWEQWVTDLVLREVRPGHAFIDIGANLGFYALLGAHLAGPGGRVVAFEPQQRLRYLLGRSLDINGFNGFSTLSPFAIGDRDATLMLSVEPGRLGDAVVRAEAHKPGAVEVKVTTLPRALAKHGVDLGERPLFMKMDIEGFEYAAWLGMRDWLAQRRQVTMVIEFSAGSYRHQGHDPLAFLADMRRIGFAVALLTHQGDERQLADAEIVAAADRAGFVDVVLRK